MYYLVDSGWNSGIPTYQLCNLRQDIHLSVPQFLHSQKGGSNTIPTELLWGFSELIRRRMSSIINTMDVFAIITSGLQRRVRYTHSKGWKQLHGKVVSKMGQICYQLTFMKLSSHAREGERAMAERRGWTGQGNRGKNRQQVSLFRSLETKQKPPLLQVAWVFFPLGFAHSLGHLPCLRPRQAWLIHWKGTHPGAVWRSSIQLPPYDSISATAIALVKFTARLAEGTCQHSWGPDSCFSPPVLML